MSLSKPAVLAGVLAAIGALALGACGGDEGEDEFAADADAICSESAAEVVALFGEAGPVESAQEDAELTEQTTEVREQALVELEAIEPPDDVAAPYEEFLSEREAGIEALAAQTEAIQGEDESAISATALEIEERFDAADAAAEEAGLTDCAGILPDADAAEVEALATDGFTAKTPRELETVCEQTTETFLTAIGGREQCLKPTPAESVEVEDVRGIGGVAASVDLTPAGGPSDGQALRVEYVYEGGQWKADAIVPQPGEPLPPVPPGE